MRNRFLAVLLILCMVISMIPIVSAAPTALFTDVDNEAWYAEEVLWAAKEGLMTGTGATTFSPEQTTTRGMIVTILWRMEDEPHAVYGSNFSDVSTGAYYYDAVQWAAEENIVGGYGNGRFGPNDPITREQLATILYRYASWNGKNMRARTDLSVYSDYASISSYAREAMSWANVKGLITGVTASTLVPQGYATRAQVATILYRYMDTLGGFGLPILPLLHAHEYEWAPNEDGTHTGTCACGHEVTEDCDTVCIDNENGTHTFTCEICGRADDEDCDYLYEEDYTETEHTKICTICDNTVTEYHEYDENYLCACGKDVTPTDGETEDPVAMIGSTGYASAQEAIDAVQDNETILLLDVEGGHGDLNLSGLSATGVTILGENTADGKVLVGKFYTAAPQSVSEIVGLTIENLTFENGGYRMEGLGTGSEDLTIKNCNFSEKAYIHLGDGRDHKNVTIEGCNFDSINDGVDDPDAAISAIIGYRIDGVTITGCTFTDIDFNAVQLFNRNDSALKGDVLIEGNTINGTGDRVFRFGPIGTEGTLTIQNNTIVSNGDEQEQLAKATSLANGSSVVLSGNTWNGKTDAATAADGKLVNLTYQAMIGSKGYATPQDAVNAVQNEETIVILEGTYDTVLDVRGGKKFTVKAEDNKKVVLAGINHATNGASSTVTFQNLTIDNTAAVGWYIGTSQNMAPCVGAWGGKLTFENCTFAVAGTSRKETGVMTWWTIDTVTLSFDHCTFYGVEDSASARAMQIYGSVNLTVTDCTFNTYKDYTLKYVGDEGYSATLSGNKVNNSENFVELGSSAYPGSKYTVYLNENTLGEGVSNYIIANEENQTVIIDGVQSVSTQTALNNAIANATGTLTIALEDGTYKMPSSNTTANISITGSKNAVIDVTLGAYLDNATLSFTGVSFKVGTGKANGTGSDYAALYSPNVAYTSCDFSGPFRIGRDGASFTGCTFNDLGNDYVWTYGNDATFTGCTFNSDGKALLIYSDGGNEVSEVSVTGCTFNATAGAKAGAIANQNCAAIEIHNYGNGVDLTTSGNTIGEHFSGEWRIKTYETGRPAVFVNDTEYTTIAIDGKLMTKDSSNNVTVL